MPANHNMPHSEEAKAKISAALSGKPAPWKHRKTREENGVTLYQCGTCMEFFPREGFYKNKRTLLGIKSECKSCHTRTSIKSRDANNARDANREYMTRARQANPEKFRKRERERQRQRDERWQARYQLNLAVRRGDIVKPARCEQCDMEKRLCGHHEDYSKPLDVKWLCYKCHGEAHRHE